MHQFGEEFQKMYRLKMMLTGQGPRHDLAMVAISQIAAGNTG
jgi:hypothetical protein